MIKFNYIRYLLQIILILSANIVHAADSASLSKGLDLLADVALLPMKQKTSPATRPGAAIKACNICSALMRADSIKRHKIRRHTPDN